MWLWAACAIGSACENSRTPEATAPAKEQAPTAQAPQARATPLRIAYSDWPGWVAWDIGIQKGWFNEAGVAVDFKWFEYLPSMEAFSAGKVDAVAMTNGDQLITGANGAANVAILINDYSNGNDMVVARPGIDRLEQLKGKKIGVELGVVSHLLLLNALRTAGMKADDVKLVNVPTDQTPQALKSGQVDAIVAWQPNSGQALREVGGAKAIFTSANLPGIIYDVLAVAPKSLNERMDDWRRVVSVWFRITEYLAQEQNRADSLRIMSARVGLTPEQYAPLLSGTAFLNAPENVKHFAPGKTLESIFYSSEQADSFNLTHGVYKQAQKVQDYLSPALVAAPKPTVPAHAATP